MFVAHALSKDGLVSVFWPEYKEIPLALHTKYIVNFYKYHINTGMSIT